MAGLNANRVYVSRKYADIYRELRIDRPTSPKIIHQNVDLFLLCCVLGFKDGNPKKLDRREEILRSDAFSSVQETVLQLIAVRSNSESGLAVLDDGDAIIKVAEEYADRGMEILIDNVLKDYLHERDDGTYTVHYNEKSTLQKELLHYIDSESRTDLFV